MKKEIVIDGKTYVLKEEETGKCDDLKFGKGDWIRKTWKDGSGDVDIFLLGEQIESLRFEMNYYIRIRKDGNVDDLSKNQSDYCIDIHEPRWTLSKLEDSEIKDHLISEAKRRYPVGTNIIPFNLNLMANSGSTVKITNTNFCKNSHYKDQYSIWVNCEEWSGVVYYQGEWAEIIKEELIKIGNHEVKKSGSGIEIGCEHFDNSELRTLNRIFNICGSENLTLRITRDDLMVNVRNGENLSTTSYEDLFKGTEIGNIKF